MHYHGKLYSDLMSRQERTRGWVFFALFILVFPFLMGLFQRSIGGEPPVAEINAIYYLLCVSTVFLVFWNYWRSSFFQFLDSLSDQMIALLSGAVIALFIQILVSFLPLPVENPCLAGYQEQFLLAPEATSLILVVLMPIVEETLFRGLLFGSLNRYSCPLAWVVSVLFHCLYGVWQFVFSSGEILPVYLILFVQYLPSALGLTFCYHKGQSVLTSTLLHMLLNGYYLWSILL